MNEIILTKTRIASGIWEGLLSTIPDTEPQILVTHLEKELIGIELAEVQGERGLWRLRVPIPADVLSDGVQTFLIQDRLTGSRLSEFTIVTGEPLENDIRAELDLLRAELDMLKRAFRRHCVETA